MKHRKREQEGLGRTEHNRTENEIKKIEKNKQKKKLDNY